jgi:hypothetical protein
MPQSPMASPSVIYHWKYRQNTFIGKVLEGKKNFSAFPVGKTVNVWFFLFPIELAMNRGITDDQNSNRQTPPVGLSVKILPMSCVSYTDEMNPLVKLFNGIVIHLIS